ncbi:lipoyl domain-containing protein [Anaerovorax sp. IOR16]|uniref:lipoyl domain-containing protein n=1 Tax=Anaerovorax sp. IOR16 TaxID=2773458 RepID=UPI0019D03416|nr:lipoyl domain-containing protein [Anaerovorax sp. IOR16]
MRVNITVPEFIMKKVGAYACKCQCTEINMEEKTGKVFWRKDKNDSVEIGDILCEIELEKNVGEVKSDYAGHLVEICMEDGDDCTLGSILGILETD